MQQQPSSGSQQQSSSGSQPKIGASKAKPDADQPSSPYKNTREYNIWDGVRLFLTQMHMLSIDQTKLTILDTSSQQYGYLMNLLDQAQSRDNIKVGIVYVKQG